MIKPKLFVLLCLLITIRGWSQYTIETIPNPKAQGQNHFVSDPNGILGSTDVDRLNEICMKIESQSSAEVAIVAIDDFEGSSDFDFAYELFNYWGIGKEENSNGLLLFIARNRRKYQFITGLGMEGTLPDVTLSTIGERYMVPKFKDGDYGGGAIDAINAIQNILQNPDAINELKAKAGTSGRFKNGNSILSAAIIIIIAIAALYWLSTFKKIVPALSKKTAYTKTANGCFLAFSFMFGFFFVVFFLQFAVRSLYTIQALPWILLALASIFLLAKYTSQQIGISRAYKDEENRVMILERYYNRYWPLILICPFIIYFFIALKRRKNQLTLRLQPPDDSGKWVRLNRDEIKGISKYLNKGQMVEEEIRSMSYEIWEHQDDKSIKLVKWTGSKYNRYEDCPSCKNRTLSKVHTKTIKAATQRSTGIGEKIQDCNCCDYKQSFGTVILPKIQRSSSSSSSGGGGRSSRSSSGGGGSWGGGRSGGGGAGGSW